MKQQPKIQTFNLLSATKKIEKIVLKYAECYFTYINFRYDATIKSYCLGADIFYTKDGSNFSATVYDFQSELTLENLLIKVEEKCREKFIKKLLA